MQTVYSEIADEIARPAAVFEAMAEVMRAVGAVGKDAKNERAGYSARSIDGVMDALHGPMARAGIFVTPMVEQVDYEVVEIGKNRTPMRQATLRVRFRFYGPDGSFVESVTVGEALDSGDKATNKAMSAAFKYALLQTFVVPLTGDDADLHHHERSEIPAATEAQREALDSARDRLGDHARKEMNAWWRERGLRIEVLSEPEATEALTKLATLLTEQEEMEKPFGVPAQSEMASGWVEETSDPTLIDP